METGPFVLIDDGTAIEVTAVVDGDTVRLSPETVDAVLGWELKPQGLCRGALCLPVEPGANLQNDSGIDLRRLAETLGRPLALDVGERAAYLGVSAADRGATLATLEAPDFRLPDLDGHHHGLSDYRGRKVLLVAYASW